MSNPRNVILVSGGSRGLGAALIGNLLEEGHVVATFSRSPSPFIESCRERDPSGASLLWEPIDGLDHDRVVRFAMSVAKRFGRIDGLVNNAGMMLEGLLSLTRPDDIHRIIALNLESAILLTRAASRIMIPRSSGCIVNISSINGLRGYRGLSVYGATKAALDGLTRSLARELGPRGIRVNGVAPGYFDSEITKNMPDEHRARILHRTPLRRFGRAEDMAKVVQFLLSPASGFITGQTIVVDGGITC